MTAFTLPQRSAVGHAGALVVVVPCLAVIAAILLYYPLSPWFLAGALALYAVLLWIWPASWLLVIPAVVPGFDLAVWTGWSFICESDLFILLTVAVLAVRDPPALRDCLPQGPARNILLLSAVAYLVGVAVGLVSPHGFTSHTDLAYLRPENGVRAAKGFVSALLLLPFLRHRHRLYGDVKLLLAAGMLAGLALVAVETLIERALFPGAFDIFSRYPAAALFSGMNVGGGHLGVYVAMALPFALLRRSRVRRIERMALRALDLAATYVVIATFSVVIYGAATVSIALTFMGRTAPRDESGQRRQGERRSLMRYALRGFYIFMLMLAGIVALVGGDIIENGVSKIAASIEGRGHSLSRRLDLRDRDLGTALVGMGLGAYPRAVTAHSGDGRSNFSVEHDGSGAYLSLMTGPAFFFGQKVPVLPGPPYSVTATFRSPGGASQLLVILCEKYLLHSQSCVAQIFAPSKPGQWQTVTGALSTAGMAPDARFGPFRRPIEFSLHSQAQNLPVDIRSVALTAPDGTEIVANGDFGRGADRWFFSDENHDYWQIMNQYFASLFEGGILGLGAFLALVGGALVGARRAMRRGDRIGTAVVASLGSFLFLCFFESPLQSVHVSVIFHLIALVGLLMLEQGTNREYLAQMRRPWTERGRSARVTSLSAFRPPS